MILIVNAGSSSIKYTIFDIMGHELNSGTVSDYADLNKVISKCSIQAIGYRIVHGGKYTNPMKLTKSVYSYLKSIEGLAPLHNPIALGIANKLMKKFPSAKHIAVFDTAFHSTIPKENYIFPIPKKFLKLGVRKYGFHGISHEYLVNRVRKVKRYKRIITCHLGSGCSISAILNGKSVDNSLGFSPNDGLMMATRSGDVDSGVIFYLKNKLKYSLSQIESMLNKNSGLLALAGTTKMQNIVKKQDENSKLAVNVFVNDVVDYISRYYVALGGCDALVFSGGIGENEHHIRKKIVDKLAVLGFYIDSKLNRQKVIDINQIRKSGPSIYVVHTNEEQIIYSHVKRLAFQ